MRLSPAQHLRLALSGGLLAVLGHAASPAPPQVHLTDFTRQTGIDFTHTDGSSGQRYIVETVSAGLATFDYNRDGKIDILFLNGSPLKGTKTETEPTIRLYRNEGNWRFTDATKEAGLGVSCYALGVAIGDYDNDGFQDIYLNNFGTNLLFHNHGDGTFSDVTARARVTDEVHVGAGTCFLDIDGDGFLDLFVGHYVDFTYANHHIVRFNGFPAYVGPLDYPTTVNRLYRNRGDGTFADVSVESGIAKHKGAAMGMVCADLDEDGDTDVCVGNDETGNFLFLNDGKGHFQESGLIAGIAYDFNGKAHGTMGVECGDYDNDGRLDLYVTSFQRESPILFRNLGKGMFEDVTAPSGAGAGMHALVTWGCGMLDLDNDGHRDLFVAAGHLQDNVDQFDTSTTYFQKNQVLRNLGTGSFQNVTTQCGNGLEVVLSSRGAAFDDLDNDGRLDVVILNSRREPTVLRNESPSTNHWLQIELQGSKCNRDAVGARVTVAAGTLKLVDEVHSGRSYQSHYGSRVHFGLGQQARVDRIEVRWPNGAPETVEPTDIDRLLRIQQGKGIVPSSPAPTSAK